MTSDATTVEAYLESLPLERRAAINAVRDTILEQLPEGYEEVMAWGMIAYQVPLATFPKTYNKKPLLYAALASQKRHMAVYLMGIYLTEQAAHDFEVAYRATGKRFDVGKSCVRFRKLEDLPLELIGEAIASYGVEDYIAASEAARAR